MARRTKKRGYTNSAGGAQAALPALSSLSDLPTFGELRVSSAQRAAFDAACARLVDEEGIERSELMLGCVVRLDRGFPAVVVADALLRAEFAVQLTKAAFSRVAVGDWVCVRMPQGHDMGLIQEILPRTNDLSRWRGGARGERQTLAANIDVVLACQALTADPINCARIARSAVIAQDCGARVVVVLTKADCAGALGINSAVKAVHAVLGSKVPCIVTCSMVAENEKIASFVEATCESGAQWGMSAVRAQVCTGTIAVVLGESGAGKSTLLNSLLGNDVLKTGAVRERDGRGRHTTVARRMVRIPDGGVVIDAPGLRSLPLVGHERGLSLVFSEIVQAAKECRFRDCTHTHEPGCVVRSKLDEGCISSARLDAYLSLANEMRESALLLDPDVAIH